MRRAAALLMLFLVVGSATGAFAAIAETGESCEEDCGEGDEGCCPLVCPRCVCAARGSAIVLPHTMALPGADWLRQADVSGEVVAPESAEADEILHVPIVAG